MKNTKQRALTPHRQTVFDVVKASKDHPSAKMVFQKAIMKSPDLSFATVYNALNFLTTKGLLREISFGNDSTRYDAILEKHDHLICRQCENVSDFFEMEDLKPGLHFTHPKDFKIEKVNVQIIGVCSKCQWSPTEAIV
ncbi:MAG: transcriptional repressor [Oligoflexia bacterium]|nr:transcriptional repressor [Oligoflexia bacterium]